MQAYYLNHPMLIIFLASRLNFKGDTRSLREKHSSQFTFMFDIRSLDVAKDLLNFLVLNSIGIISPDNTILFSEVDRLLALRSGCDIERIAKALNWKDFESFASGNMKELGYKVQTNITLTKPRFRIDLVGICSNLAVVADYKHWRYSNRSMIIKVAINQIRRAA